MWKYVIVEMHIRSGEICNVFGPYDHLHDAETAKDNISPDITKAFSHDVLALHEPEFL